MFGTIVAWLIYALFIKIAVGLATDVDSRNNSLGRAFVTAAVLSLGHAIVAHLGSIFVLLWPIAWLLILKRMYEIGWGRAILVWLALIAIAVALALLVLVPLGLASAITFGAFAL
jgi:hypothetical protein